MKRFSLFGVVVLTLGLCILSGCSGDKDEGTSLEPVVGEGGGNPVPLGQYWGNRIVSEAFYSLNQSRTGGSNVSYHGWAMSDWNYVESDRDADKRISWYIGGCGNRGGAGGTVSLQDYNSTWKTCHKGGYCKYFVDLVLYRSSYGWGGNKHLVLPSGTSYATRSVYDAQPGWVLQSSMPHSGIVVARYGGGLDVIDSNWVGGDGNYAISRHFMSWSELISKGFKAYNPWASPVLISRSGSRTQCY